MGDAGTEASSGSETGSGETSSTGGTGDAGDATSSTGNAAESESGGPSCTDLAQNSDETDVDCGGACPACDAGGSCVLADDCVTAICEQSTCCSATTYERSTGLISGSAMVCCDGEDARLGLVECGDGMNYSISEVRPNCASTSEGAMNNGSACVTITCQQLDCTPS